MPDVYAMYGDDADEPEEPRKPESKYSDERLQELVRGYMVWEAGTLNTSRIESDDELTEADYARIQVLIDTADVEITWR